MNDLPPRLRALTLLSTLLFSVVISLALSSRVSAQPLPSDPQPSCTVSPSTVAGWFEGGKPVLNGVVTPVDSTALDTSKNCNFYAWAQHMFLWLTSPAASYGRAGRVFNSNLFYDVSPPDPNTGNRNLIPNEPGPNANSSPTPRILALRDNKHGEHGLPTKVSKAGRLFEIDSPKLGPSGKPLISTGPGKTVEVEQITVEKGKAVFHDKANKVIPNARPLLRTDLTKLLKAGPGKVAVVQRFVIGGLPIFIDPFGNVIEFEQGEAGTGAVLEAQNGSLVYYGITVNDVYAYFVTGVVDGGITPSSTPFPTKQTELTAITNFAKSHGKIFTPTEAKTLTIELKTAWVQASSVANPDTYITMEATIPTYDTSSSVSWVPNGQQTVKLALVGMHIVGTSTSHPEMIWATFEHFGNTPSGQYSYTSTNGSTVTVPMNTGGTWLFCAANSSGPFNNQHMDVTTNPPNITADPPPGSTATPPPYTISASDTLRTAPFGASDNVSPNTQDPSAALSNSDVIAANNVVLSQLISGDVRANYYLVGATWTFGGAAPGGNYDGKAVTPTTNEVGTSVLANTTMETYVQSPIGNAWSAQNNNCFACHGRGSPAIPSNLSHIFANLNPLFPAAATKTAPKKR
jgi:hypothetical protein